MKKVNLFIICLALILAFSGCGSHTEQPTEVPTNAPTETSLSTEEPTQPLVRNPTEDDIPDIEDLLPQLQNEVQEIIDLYKSSDEVKQYNVYDSSSLAVTYDVVCVFYKDGEIAAVKKFNLEDGRINITYAGNVESNFKKCLEVFPNFEILGFIGSTPAGKIDGKGYILSYYSLAQCIKPILKTTSEFSTMEEGFRLRAEYNAIQAKIEAEIPVFKWATLVDNNTEERGYHPTIYGPIYHYDRMVVCPLLDENGKEEVYICHLLYLRNRLIGEVVCTKDKKFVLKRYGEYDERSKTYAPIEKSLYLEAIDEYRKSNPGKTVTAIGFDGENFIVAGK